MKIILISTITFFLSLFTACRTQTEENSPNTENNTVKPATVLFVNHTSYTVNIYKNINPQNSDPTALVVTLRSGSDKRVEQYPSFDQVFGDSFYPRYRILLADTLNDMASSPIYVDAQRVLANITFVIEAGKNYTKMIPQPIPEDLRFYHGYIRVHNHSATPIQIRRGSIVLSRLDTGTVWLNSGTMGYYEIAFSFFDDTINMNQMRAYSSTEISFPSFIAERGKIDFFEVTSSEVRHTGSRNIDPLRK